MVYLERVVRLFFGIFFFVFYVIGIIGNSYVIYIFCNLLRRKILLEVIILVLVIFDIVINLVFIFKEYNRMRFVLVDNNEFICKLLNFSGFLVGLVFVFFVFVLVLYRYCCLFILNIKEIIVLFIVIKLLVCLFLVVIFSIFVLFIIGY